MRFDGMNLAYLWMKPETLTSIILQRLIALLSILLRKYLATAYRPKCIRWVVPPHCFVWFFRA